MTAKLSAEELENLQRLCETARDDIARMFGDSHYDRQTWAAIKPHLDYLTDAALRLTAQVREAEAQLEMLWQWLEQRIDSRWSDENEVEQSREVLKKLKSLGMKPLPPPPAREGIEG